jgi:hypothetical protein
LREQGCEYLWLFFEAKQGPRVKEVWETYVCTVSGKPG